MAFLLTGGTAAQTSREIAHSCEAAKIPYLFASRSSSLSSTNPPCARFDWTDPSTYSNCFSYEFSGGEKLTAVYMIMPRVPELDKHMNAFIDYASNHGIKRFVLMAGTTTVLGGPGPGKVWEHLSDKGLDFAICKPTWFMDNFTSTGYHLNTIREESKFYTCTGDAKIPFVSVEDISSVAFAALTIKKAPNTELRIVGPQALTHDELAAQLSAVLGRNINHVKISPEKRLEQMLTELKLEEFNAQFMVFLEKLTAEGKDDVDPTLSNSVEKLTGHHPMTFKSFAAKHKNVLI